VIDINPLVCVCILGSDLFAILLGRSYLWGWRIILGIFWELRPLGYVIRIDSDTVSQMYFIFGVSLDRLTLVLHLINLYIGCCSFGEVCNFGFYVARTESWRPKL
jgi:hypothetical protein